MKTIDSPICYGLGTLERSLYVLKNNEPINRREGNIGQADLEARAIIQTETAINMLKLVYAIQD